MEIDNKIQIYFQTILNERLYSNRRNLEFHLNFLFEKIEFHNKKVLDIGGGNGLYSFYAACRGAKEVICLEPEVDGSSSVDNDKFGKLSNIFGFNNVKLELTKIQDFKPDGRVFDIIILFNSINHLDEISCINLLNNNHSYDIYKDIFTKIWTISSAYAKLLITDVSKFNFYNKLGLTNPLARKIEWNKHQSPQVWIRLLSESGYENPKLKWLSFNTLGYFGNLVTGNKFFSYFLNSYFYLIMQRSSN